MFFKPFNMLRHYRNLCPAYLNERDEVLWVGLSVVEDDEHGRIVDVVHHRIVRGVAFVGNGWGLLQRRVALGEPSRQDSSEGDATVTLTVARAEPLVNGVVGVGGKVNAISEFDSCTRTFQETP